MSCFCYKIPRRRRENQREKGSDGQKMSFNRFLPGNSEQKMSFKSFLPADCIAHIISFMTPRDVCRSSLISRAFHSAANSDVVWERLLPPDYREIISNPALLALPKKHLYFHLCDNPIIVDDGNRSFALEKKSGKKCYMIRARMFYILFGDDPYCWTWEPLPQSRFSEVAHLRFVLTLSVDGKINTKILSPKTTYAAYLVFNFVELRCGFAERRIELCVQFDGSMDRQCQHVFLDPPDDIPQLSRSRGDGWMEIEMGSFFNENGDDRLLSCSLWDCDYEGISKGGLLIEGIELRPKEN